jgi:hypothetical protein
MLLRSLIPSPAPSLIMPPACTSNVAGGAWPAVNRAVFVRFTQPQPGSIRYINWVVGVASGNVQLGLVQLSGSGLTSYTRIAHTGVIACPTAGDIRTDLGATALGAGTYAAFIWADNTTFQARYSTASGIKALRIAAIASSLASGVPASGTLSYDTAFVQLTLEGDV